MNNKLHTLIIGVFILFTFTQVQASNDVVLIGTSRTLQGDWNTLLNRTDVINRGVTGYYTSDVVNTAEIVTHFTPAAKICFVEGGINDVINNIPISTIVQNLETALNNLKAHNVKAVAQSVIYQAQTNVYDNNYFAHNLIIKQINDQLQAYCNSNNFDYLDLNSVLSANGQLKTELSIDGTHLNSDGYTLWASLVQPEIANVLPIELISFTAKGDKVANVLSWQTISEVNTSHFDVERSDDGKNFEKIGKILAYGNSNNLKNYYFTDAQPLFGVNYYRLHAVDLDGTSTISKIISIFSTENKDLQVFPNPAKDKITISGTHQSDFIIFDFLGREILRGELTNKTDLDISSFQIGYYFLNVGNESVKFFKE